MSRQPLIIQNPSLQTLKQRYAFAALTLVFWLVWFYLWTPVITLLAWLFGADRFYETMIARSGIDMLVGLLGLYGLVILSMGIVLGGWAWYNRLRVRGRDKRRGSAAILPVEVNAFFMLSQEQADIARRGRRVVIEHDEDGQVRDVRTAEIRTKRSGNDGI